MTVPNNVITSDMLKGGKKGQGVAGLILCRSYSVSLTKSGKEYIQGTMQSGIEIQFKAWGNEEAFVKGRKMKDFGATVHIFSENLSERA